MATKEKLLKFEKWKKEKIDEALHHREIDRHCENCKYGNRQVGELIEACSYGCTFRYYVKCSITNKIIKEPEAYTGPTNCSYFEFPKCK